MPFNLHQEIQSLRRDTDISHIAAAKKVLDKSVPRNILHLLESRKFSWN